MLFAFAVFANETAAGWSDPGVVAAMAAGWGSAGVGGMIIRWLINKHIPAVLASAGEQLKAEQVNSEKRLAAAQAAFTDALATIVENCKEENAALVVALNKVSDQQRASDGHSDEQHKETRHLVAQMAHTLGLKLAVGELKLVHKKPPAADPPAQPG